MLLLVLTSTLLTAGAPTPVARAFDTADLASCLALTAHPEDPLRVSLVTQPDGGWTIALDGGDQLAPDEVLDCLTEATRAVLKGLTFSSVPSVFVRVVGNPDTQLSDAFEVRRASIEACVLARLPKSEPDLTAQLRLGRDASGALKVSLLGDSPRFLSQLSTCVKASLRAGPGPATADVEVHVVRPLAWPRHDGTLGAVCTWAEPAGKPTPKACRSGLSCQACRGIAPREPIDVTCVRPCGPVP
jgi:hypothetical protein